MDKYGISINPVIAYTVHPRWAVGTSYALGTLEKLPQPHAGRYHLAIVIRVARFDGTSQSLNTFRTVYVLLLSIGTKGIGKPVR
jgi:hypothetical protein